MMKFVVVWSEQRSLSEQEIETCYEDAVDNGDADPGLIDPVDMVKELSNIGYFTFVRAETV